MRGFKTSKFRKNRCRLDRSMQNDLAKTVVVLIWSETDQNTPFLNKRSKTLKKTRARRQKNRDFKYRARRHPISSRLARARRQKNQDFVKIDAD